MSQNGVERGEVQFREDVGCGGRFLVPMGFSPQMGRVLMKVGCMEAAAAGGGTRNLSLCPK
ncbi:hypothetical protein [Falsibacillus pallidus]|uniref:hypothetical protein n=1 Tax=Falsibacillus pallidus TaxID=493781 RepID=UPI003D9591DA